MRVVYDDNNTSETHNAKDTAGYDVGSDFAFLFHVSSGGSEKKKTRGTRGILYCISRYRLKFA